MNNVACVGINFVWDLSFFLNCYINVMVSLSGALCIQDCVICARLHADEGSSQRETVEAQHGSHRFNVERGLYYPQVCCVCGCVGVCLCACMHVCVLLINVNSCCESCRAHCSLTCCKRSLLLVLTGW